MATTTTNSALTYTPIAWTTIGSSVSAFTLSSIPSGYTDLRLVMYVIEATSADMWFTFNNDSATNYSWRLIYGNGSTVGSSATQSVSYISMNNAAQSYSYMFSIDVSQYANTGIYKTALFSVATDTNGTTNYSPQQGVGTWRSTAAISSITLTAGGLTFSAGTTCALYGIKAA